MAADHAIQTDRIPPQDLDMEQAVLGAMLIERAAVDKAAQVLRPVDFYRDAHRWIFEAIMALTDRSEPVDLLTIQAELRMRGNLEEIGGGSYLVQVMDAVPAAANINYYARIVQERAVQRRLLDASSLIQALAHSEGESIEAVIEKAERAVYNVGARRQTGELISMDALACEAFDYLDDPIGARGIPTGFNRLDTLTLGLHPGELTVIAGCTSVGKTSLALCIARNVAASAGPVLFFSLEMPRKDLMLRLLASEIEADLYDLRAARLTPQQRAALNNVRERLVALPLYLMDNFDVSLSCIRSRARQIGGKLSLIVVDYLQIMTPDGSIKDGNETQRLDAAMRLLKQMAGEFNAPVIVLSQLSRSPAGRISKRPILSDLRSSGGIEQNADNVWFIYAKSYYDTPSQDAIPVAEIDAEIILAKQRQGVRNVSAKMLFKQFCVKFTDAPQPYAPPAYTDADIPEESVGDAASSEYANNAWRGDPLAD